MKTKIESRIIRLVAQIDILINLQVNSILHHTGFQALESSWRALLYLVSQINRQKYCIIKILDLSYQDFQKDLINAIEFDQTQLFKKIYDQEFDLPGGQPYGLLIGNYELGPAIKEFDSLEMMMQISAASFAPFICGASPTMFGIDYFSALSPALKFENLYKLPQYERWLHLRRHENARYTGIVMPRILLRQPYNQYGDKPRNRFFQETLFSSQDYLWGNAAFAHAHIICRSFIESGWLADIRGFCDDRTGGAITDLPRCHFSVNRAMDIAKTSTDIYLTDQQEKTLNDLGFITLRDHVNLRTAVFYGSQSIQHTPVYNRSIAIQNTHLSGMLHYMLCASRFAHYIKVIIRDKIGKFITAESCEHFIQQWLLGYCAAGQHISNGAKARYPLNEAQVTLQRDISLPGKYLCIIHLKPHYQLDEIQTHLKLVTHVNLNREVH